MKVLLTNVNELVKTTPLSGNIDPDKIVEFINMAQEIYVQQLTGTDLYNKVIELVNAGTISDAGNAVYKTLLDTYIKPIVNHQTFVLYLPFAAVTVSSKGLFKHTSENSNELSTNEMEMLLDKWNGHLNFYKQRLTDFLCANSEDYPEYYTNTEEDINPTRHNSNLDWYLY